jgi:putative membrane protein
VGGHAGRASRGWSRWRTAAGYLFCWAVLAGSGFAPHAAGLRLRLGVLFVSMAAQALWPGNTPHRAAEIQAAARLMYYGGDLAELLLAAALFAMWYRTPASRRYRFFPGLSAAARLART